MKKIQTFPGRIYMSKFLFLFFFSLSIFAQDQLETIHVSSNGDKNPEAYTFGDTQLLNEDDIKQSGSPFISEILKSVPSLTVVQAGGAGAATSLFLRGTEAGHTAIMVDHLKVNDPSSVNRAFNPAFTLSPDLDEVIILKSPQPVLYGNDAIGGAILFKTRKGPKEGEKPQTLISVGAGSFSSFQETLRQDWQTQKHQGTVTGTHYKTMGISRLNKKRVQNSSERDGAEVVSVGSSSTHKWSTLETDLLVKFIHGETEYDGYGPTFDYADDKNNRSYNDQYLVQQKTRKKFDLGTIQLRQGLNRHQRKDLSGTSQTNNEGNVLSNELTLVSLIGKFESTSGVAYDHETFTSEDVDKSFDLTSLFLHTKYNLNKWSFHGGARADHHSRYGNFSSGSAGINYSLVESIDLFAQYAQGMKAPTLYQLYAPSNFGPLGNKDLRPEKNKTTEAGIKFKSEIGNLSITVFQNNLDSLITYSMASGYQNQGHFIAQGIETNLDAPLGEKFRLSAGFTHQKFLASSLPLRRPTNNASGTLFFAPTESLEFYWRERVVSSREDIDAFENRVKLNPYRVSSAGGKWSKGDYELSLSIENIFDVEYEDLYANSVMPLSFWSNISYRF
jgi:vitamin B12 transporter